MQNLGQRIYKTFRITNISDVNPNLEAQIILVFFMTQMVR